MPLHAFSCCFKRSLNQDDSIVDFICFWTGFSWVFSMPDFEFLGQGFSVVPYLIVRIGLILWNQVDNMFFIDNQNLVYEGVKQLSRQLGLSAIVFFELCFDDIESRFKVPSLISRSGYFTNSLLMSPISGSGSGFFSEV